jgi:hypothetical protein
MLKPAMPLMVNYLAVASMIAPLHQPASRKKAVSLVPRQTAKNVKRKAVRWNAARKASVPSMIEKPCGSMRNGTGKI